MYLALFWFIMNPFIKLPNNYLPQGMVYLEDVDPSIHQKMSFATEENFLGVFADGYEKGKAICT